MRRCCLVGCLCEERAPQWVRARHPNRRNATYLCLGFKSSLLLGLPGRYLSLCCTICFAELCLAFWSGSGCHRAVLAATHRTATAPPTIPRLLDDLIRFTLCLLQSTDFVHCLSVHTSASTACVVHAMMASELTSPPCDIESSSSTWRATSSGSARARLYSLLPCVVWSFLLPLASLPPLLQLVVLLSRCTFH